MDNTDTTYVLQAHAYLLECNLATYDMLCGKSKSPQNELNRQESILKDQFQATGKMMLETRKVSSVPVAAWRTLPRVDEILERMGKGDTYEEACQRYFNKVRYGVGK